MHHRILTSALAFLLIVPASAAAGDVEYDQFLSRLEQKTHVQGELALRIIALGLENA